MSRDILELMQDVFLDERLQRSSAHEIYRHPDEAFQKPLEPHIVTEGRISELDEHV